MMTMMSSLSASCGPYRFNAHVVMTQGSWTPAPQDASDENGAVGDVCPPGYYCTTGSVSPRACPSGKYSLSTGNTNSSACLLCEPGFMCPNASTDIPTEPCPQGFYCPAGACAPGGKGRGSGEWALERGLSIWYILVPAVFWFTAYRSHLIIVVFPPKKCCYRYFASGAVGSCVACDSSRNMFLE